MDEDTRNYLHNVCFALGGVANRQLANGIWVGRGTGLTEAKTRSILYLLNDDGYIALDERYPFTLISERVTLTLKGARWYAHNRHLRSSRGPRFRVQLPITGTSVQRQYRYRRPTIPRTRSRVQYHRTIRVAVHLPECPAARYEWGQWTCENSALAVWFNFVTRHWFRRHGYDARRIGNLVEYVIQEYEAYRADSDTSAPKIAAL